MSEITFNVNTASAGGNGTTNGLTGSTAAYASWAAFLAARATDLPTDGDNYVILMDGAGGDDTTRPDINGWTTGSGNDLVFRQNPAGSAYSLKLSDSLAAILNREDYVTIDGISIENTYASGASAFNNEAGSPTSGDNLTILKNCRFRNSSTSSSNRILSISEVNLIIQVINCTFVTGGRFADSRRPDCTLAYCTVIQHADQWGLLADASTDVKNCYIGKTVSASNGDYFNSNPDPTGSNNASSDTTATVLFPSSNSINSLDPDDQFTNVTAGSEDLTLKVGSTLIDSATPVAGIPTDIIGTTRDATTPDIGAFEFVSGGGGTFKPYWALNRSSIINPGIS